MEGVDEADGCHWITHQGGYLSVTDKDLDITLEGYFQGDIINFVV